MCTLDAITSYETIVAHSKGHSLKSFVSYMLTIQFVLALKEKGAQLKDVKNSCQIWIQEAHCCCLVVTDPYTSMHFPHVVRL